jgi:protein involved in polysaccharide export with SLBB domain
MFTMKSTRCGTGRGVVLTALCFSLGSLLAGCGSMDQGYQTAADTSSPTVAAQENGSAKPAPSELLSVGDKVVVDFNLAGHASTDQPLSKHDENIRQDGTITMDTIGPVQAAGKTPGGLQRDIFNLYVPRYYTSNLNVTVTAPERVYYVGGEVKQSNRYLYTQATTVTKAIQSAGDFTEFANKKKVKLIRADGSIFIINCIKALEDPSLDLPVYPGDKISVPRHW